MKVFIQSIFTFVLLLNALPIIHAQSLSFEGGYITTQYNNMSPFTQSKGGFQFGVAYIKPIKDSVLHLKTGLHYQQLDGIGTINHFNQVNQVVLSYEKSQELYYLHIPLLLQYQTPVYKSVNIGLLAGVTGNYLLRAWHNPQSIRLDHNVTENFQRFVLGYQAGTYTQIKFTPAAHFQLTYLFGSNLTLVQKDAGQSGFTTHAIVLGLVYDLKQKRLFK